MRMRWCRSGKKLPDVCLNIVLFIAIKRFNELGAFAYWVRSIDILRFLKKTWAFYSDTKNVSRILLF